MGAWPLEPRLGGKVDSAGEHGPRRLEHRGVRHIVQPPALAAPVAGACLLATLRAAALNVDRQQRGVAPTGRDVPVVQLQHVRLGGCLGWSSG